MPLIGLASATVMAAASALGNLARFILLPGQRHDSVGAETLISGVAIGALVADKAFDSDWLRAELNRRGAIGVIPPKASLKGPHRLRLRDVQMAPSDRKLLLQAQGIPQNRNALREDGRKL